MTAVIQQALRYRKREVEFLLKINVFDPPLSPLLPVAITKEIGGLGGNNIRYTRSEKRYRQGGKQ